jgi:hypothetical protein
MQETFIIAVNGKSVVLTQQQAETLYTNLGNILAPRLISHL